MAQTEPLEPPIDAVFEVETIGFDFGMILAPGETITAVLQMLCAVLSGIDASPASRLIGTPQVAASNTTGAPRAEVLQKFGTAVAGCSYSLQCVVSTTDGQSLSLITSIACEPSVS